MIFFIAQQTGDERTVFYPHLGGQGAKWFRCALPVGVRFTFCIAQKVTKMLVALKTRLFIRAFIWFPGLLARLFVFQVLFLSSVVPHGALSLHETDHTRCSNSLARQSGAYSK